MKRIAGVSERLLECARNEFIDKGFQAASIREIAKKQKPAPALSIHAFPIKRGFLTQLFRPFQTGLSNYIRIMRISFGRRT